MINLDHSAMSALYSAGHVLNTTNLKSLAHTVLTDNVVVSADATIANEIVQLIVAPEEVLCALAHRRVATQVQHHVGHVEVVCARLRGKHTLGCGDTNVLHNRPTLISSTAP